MRQTYFLILSLLITACNSGISEEIIILPQGFHGIAVIVYNSDSGMEEDLENEKRIYKIPESGVYRADFEMPMNWLSRKYFYANDNGDSLKQIPVAEFGEGNKAGDLKILESYPMSDLTNSKRVYLFILIGRDHELDSLKGLSRELLEIIENR